MEAPNPYNNLSPESIDQLRSSLERQTRWNRVSDVIHTADSFADAMPQVLPDLLLLLAAERLTIYQRARNGREIVSKLKIGDAIKEIRVPLSATSISGYCALSHETLRIRDVYDAQELASIHPQLCFDKSFDQKSGFRSRSMLVVPIKQKDILLGVVQVINRVDGQAFSDVDLETTQKLAQVIAQKFRYELQVAQSPYDYLMMTGKLTQAQLDYSKERAAAEGISVEGLLISEHGLSISDVGASLEHYYQVPFMRYDPKIMIPKELIAGINESYLRKQGWVPVEGDRKDVTVVIDNPADIEKIMEIQRVLHAENFSFRVGVREDIQRFLGGDGSGAEAAGPAVSEILKQLSKEAREGESSSAAAPGDAGDEAQIIQLVNKIIIDAFQQSSSDIHVEPGKGGAPTQVRFRIDGVCRIVQRIPPEYLPNLVARIKVMARLDISERRKPQDGKLTVKIQNRPVELRVATLPTVHGESVVMRILAASKPLPMEKLGLSEWNKEAITEAINNPHGIFLVVGPTGSGKTTTLHSLLSVINTPERKIWTAEDPVEITQPGLQQMQMQPKIGLTFATALRAFLRADPDVIMIGEMRDQETAEAGVEASLTGHLVFSTLHTNSAAETIVRLLDLGIDPINFADAYKGCLAQRLGRTLCKKCKQSYAGTEEEYDRLRHFYGEAHFDELGLNPKDFTLYKAVGCPACDETGYRGRIGIHEMMKATPEITEMIYCKATAGELRRKAMEQGMRTLMQDGIRKVLGGAMDMTMLRKVVAE